MVPRRWLSNNCELIVGSFSWSTMNTTRCFNWHVIVNWRQLWDCQQTHRMRISQSVNQWHFQKTVNTRLLLYMAHRRVFEEHTRPNRCPSQTKCISPKLALSLWDGWWCVVKIPSVSEPYFVLAGSSTGFKWSASRDLEPPRRRGRLGSGGGLGTIRLPSWSLLPSEFVELLRTFCC